jgi:hypothetical protein
MRVTQIAISLLFICMCTSSLAQTKTSRWSSIEYHFQNRLFHKGMGYQTFSTKIDIGFGVNRKRSLLDNLDLEIGLTANYGSFKSKSDGTLFVSSFKTTDIHYFSHDAVSQLNIEVPIGVQLKLLKLNESSLHLTVSVIPQIGILAKHTGTSWDENITIIQTLLNSNDPFREFSLLSDFYLRSGLSYSFFKNKVSIGSGVEFSVYGESVGLYSKLGFSF